MIPIFCQWLITGFTAFGVGSLIKKISRIETSRSADNLLLTFLVGLSIISWLGCIWSLVFPLNKYFLLFSLLLAVLGSVSAYKPLNKSTFNGLLNKECFFKSGLLLFLTVISFLLARGITNNADHFEYYLPTVKWMENFPVVPGSALFNHRIGNNSNFHLLSAVFSFHDIRREGTYALNGLLFILFYSYFLSRIPRLLKKMVPSNALAVSAAFFPFTFLLDSMDVDYLTIMGGIFILVQCLKISEEQNTRNNKVLSIFLIILFLTTVRMLSALYFLPFLLVCWNKLNKNTFYIMTLLSLVFMTPWFLRNYFVTGYLIFPIYYIDLFSPIWKTPVEVTTASYDIISEFAKVNIIRDGYLYEGMREWRLSEWFPIWIKNQILILIGLFTIIGIPIAFVASIFNNLRARSSTPHILGLNFTFYFVIVLWFFNFPSIRFIWPWILSFIIINGYLFVSHQLKSLRGFICYGIILLAFFGFGSVFYKSLTAIPQEEFQEITFDHNTETIDKIQIKRSTNSECGDLMPPCLPQHNDLEIIPLGDRIEDGFRVND